MQPLQAVVARAHDALAPLGLGPTKQLFSSTMAHGETRTVKLDAPPGCTRVDVLAGAPVVGTRGHLWNSSDLVASSEGGEHLVLFGCTPNATTFELELEVVGRPGPVVAEARSERGDTEALCAAPLAAGRLLARANAAGRLVPAKALHQVRSLTIDPTRRATFPVQVPVGTCRGVIAALDRDVERLRLTATGEEARDLGTARGGHVAQLELCAPHRPLQAQVSLTVEAGKGTALVGVTSLPDAKP
jgi:hypothetical protein